MNRLESLGWHALCAIWPKMAVRIQYRHILGESINFKSPKDLNEKINYLKFHADLKEWARLADKFVVREYVIERGLGNILIPLYGKYDTPKELIQDWGNFPRSFVIKANNGCGTVKLIKNKETINKNELLQELTTWLKNGVDSIAAERHYSMIKPCLVVEQMLEESGKDVPVDYKIWCFNGKPYCILVITGRDEKHHKIYRSMYDLQWKRMKDALPHNDTYTDAEIPKPNNFERMLQVASILTKGHKEVRMDLYNIDGRIYFGEMTFTSRGGYNNYDKQLLLDMGSQFDVK